MRKSVVIAVVVLVPLALLLLFLGGPDREYTTTSAKAYEHFEKGYSQILAFQFAQADSQLRLALRIDPHFAAALALASQLDARAGRDTLSKREASRADSLGALLPNALERAKVRLLLSATLGMSSGERDSLITVILTEQPDNVMALTAEANQEAMSGEYDQAEKVYHHILEIEPNHAPAYNMLGYAAANRGDYDQAVNYLRKYAFMAPGLANPHDSLGEVLSWKGDYAEAEQEFLAAVKIQPDFYPSLINLGRIYLEQGMISKGEEILEQVRGQISGTPQERQIDETLIRMYYSHELYDESLAVIDRYIEKYPDYFVTDFYRAISLLMHGDRAKADAMLAKFVAAAKEQDIYAYKTFRTQVESLQHQFLGMAATRDGDYDTAVQEYQKVLDLSQDLPVHTVWWFRWRQGEAYLASGRPEPAMADALAILKANSSLIRPLLLLARSSWELGKPDITRKALQKLQPLMARADARLPSQKTYRDLLAQVTASASN